MNAQAQGLDELIVRLRTMGGEVRRRLLVAVTREAIALEGVVKADKLSGQVLRNVTGRLRSSIHHEVEAEETHIVGIVGANMAKARYAAFHEYGFHGAEQVAEHIRTIHQAFGRPITPREVLVRAHSRAIDYPGRSYLRSTLAERADGIRARIEAAGREGVQP
jgi:phage gpG-like protein